MKDFEAIIGLEVHAQLATRSKLFATDANRFGDESNTNISAVSLAHPGTLPMLNEEVFPAAIKLGLACKSKITSVNYFDRKNYYYPDLPKGYQITQDNTPICVGGEVEVFINETTKTKVTLDRIHIEEDAGKSKHNTGNYSEINYNRAGVPLLEIVTTPCIKEEETAAAFLTEIRKMLRWLEIGRGNMEQGQLRCDVNISMAPKGAKEFGTKVEIKNLNSIRNVKRAIKSEIKRQTKVLTEGGQIQGNTRDFDDLTGESKALRSKESLNDYRYFPDPDISPYIVDEKLKAKLEEELPVLPSVIYEKMIADGFLKKDADFLTSDRATAFFYVETCKHTKQFKKVANWLMGPIQVALNEDNRKMNEILLKPEALADLIEAVSHKKITATQANQQLFPALWKNHKKRVDELIVILGLDEKHDDDAVLNAVQTVLDDNPEKVKAFKAGKKGLLQMFIGQSMKLLKGKADANTIKEIIEKKLS